MTSCFTDLRFEHLVTEKKKKNISTHQVIISKILIHSVYVHTKWQRKIFTLAILIYLHSFTAYYTQLYTVFIHCILLCLYLDIF